MSSSISVSIDTDSNVYKPKPKSSNIMPSVSSSVTSSAQFVSKPKSVKAIEAQERKKGQVTVANEDINQIIQDSVENQIFLIREEFLSLCEENQERIEKQAQSVKDLEKEMFSHLNESKLDKMKVKDGEIDTVKMELQKQK